MRPHCLRNSDNCPAYLTRSSGGGSSSTEAATSSTRSRAARAVTCSPEASEDPAAGELEPGISSFLWLEASQLKVGSS